MVTDGISVPEPGILAASLDDPAPAGLSRFVGGRWGKHAQGPTSWWWTPLRVALALTVLFSVFGYLAKSPCLSHAYTGEYQYTRLCYTDTYTLYTNEGLNERTQTIVVKPAAHGKPAQTEQEVTGAVSVPYRDHSVEYPPVMGGLMYVAAEITHFLHPGETADVDGTHDTTFFNLTALGLALCALISTFTVAQLVGRRQWDTVLLAVSPVLAMYAFTNWDLAAVAATGLGLWAWSRGSPLWAGLLLGVGVATKLYPVFVLLAILMLCVRAGLFRAAGRAILGTLIGVVVCYLPAIVISKRVTYPGYCNAQQSFPGWEWFTKLSETRGADWGSVWLLLQHVFAGDAIGRTLNSQPACGASPTTLNILSGACVFIAVVAVFALVLLARRRPRLGQIAFLLVAGFVFFNKVDSPQYALWLVPLAVLARPRWASIMLWQASEVIIGAANLYTFVNEDHSDQGLTLNGYLGFEVLRDVVLIGLIALIVRDVLVPRGDVVRRDGVDDPAGGPLDGAPDLLALAR